MLEGHCTELDQARGTCLGTVTDKLCNIRNTSGAFGREWTLWSQQRWANSHNPSVKVEWVGRGRRSPAINADMAARGDLSLNGTAPVKTFIKTNEI